MRFLIAAFVGVFVFGLCTADNPTPAPSQPVVGEWNYTNAPHGPGSTLCIKLQAGIRLDVDYDTVHNGTKTASIYSSNDVTVDESKSVCINSSSDQDETLALSFNANRNLSLYFTRDSKITKDDTGNRWQLYKVKFAVNYDPATFPDAQGAGDDLFNTNTTVAGIATSKDRSFSCSKADSIKVTDRFRISFNNLRLQAFMTGDDFSTADHCAADQETTDLIPIIIGAALAALVIIVLIAYLIGRARANTPAYDNMK